MSKKPNNSEPQILLSLVRIMNEIVAPRLKSGEGKVLPDARNIVREPNQYIELFPGGPQAHPDIEWMFLISGSSYIRIEESIYRVNAGDFCFLPSNISHGEVLIPTSESYESIWFTYHAAGLFTRVFDYKPGSESELSEGCITTTSPVMPSLLQALHTEARQHDSHATEIKYHLMTTLVHLTMRSLEQAVNFDSTLSVSEYISRRVVDYLYQHYTEDISLDSVASAVHMSRNYLTAVFKRETGKTIGEALTEIRMQKAKLLLAEREMSINAIAHAVGYSSPEHFCRVFRQRENIAPSRYLK